MTRQPNKNILEFAQYLSDKQVPVWIRHVLVPGLTDFDDHLIKLGEFVKTLKNVDKFEILPYHTMGEFKWRELGIPYPWKGLNHQLQIGSKMLKLSCTLKRIKSIKSYRCENLGLKKKLLTRAF